MRLGVIMIGFLIFRQKCDENMSKINRTSINAVALEKNCDQNRIPHGLKPNSHWSFCFWSHFGPSKKSKNRHPSPSQEDPQNLGALSLPWEWGAKHSPSFSYWKSIKLITRDHLKHHLTPNHDHLWHSKFSIFLWCHEVISGGSRTLPWSFSNNNIRFLIETNALGCDYDHSS